MSSRHPQHPALVAFHPAVATWFARSFPAPTEAQVAAWPAIASGRDTLVAAPTGSGKTLTAFFTAIDGLVREGLSYGLPDATLVLYVSPLKALSNDIHVNLEAPLQGIRDELAAQGLPDVDIRTAVRTGDTPQSERAALRRRPPHILVTTPESLYVLLGSESGRAMLSAVRTVIVDEIHALVQSKRGSHLALSLERLDALTGRRATRVGLSATQKPIETVGKFLVGAGAADPAIVDIGHARKRDLALELPPVPLEAVMSNAQWDLVYERIAQLVEQHATTLVFVNTRRMAERAARHLGELLGKEHVAAHHGSLAKELRLDAEQKLKRGELKVLVATASLELGIDIGDVDLVCQIGSPRSIAAFLQRVGRSGHHVGGVPKGRLFPSSRDELLESAALLDAVRRGELDALIMPPAPLDVLAQQIVAEVACREWDEDELFEVVRRAWPYAQLDRKGFDEVVRMLADGFSTRYGQRAAYLHRDAVHRKLRGRKGARMTATLSGGTIPDTADYQVVLEPHATMIGTINEDFAIESIAGDIFQLGNTSYRILRVEAGRVRVEDAEGAPPSIPFWLGEAPGRSIELSASVSRLREAMQDQLERGGEAELKAWLLSELRLGESAAAQIAGYAAAQFAGFGLLPSQSRIALERFFDESGGTQLIIHSPYGSRINKAWGLALRKRFCRKFNFELQAAATEDAIVLSLSTSHSFPLIEVMSYLHSSSAEQVLVQALLDAPLFPARFRWNATTALALPRFVGGTRVAPQLQRMKSEDLMATVFPDQVACLENIVGEREVPDHPLVAQTLHDCLREAMDVDGWLALLRALEAGEVQVVARDLTGPSPFAAEVLSARPYAFLDDAPLEERRTRAVQTRGLGATQAEDLGRLDLGAIEGAREDAWPQPRDQDEMHEALMQLGTATAGEAEASGWNGWLERLAKARRATRLMPHALTPTGLPMGEGLWVTAERLPQLLALHPQAACEPCLEVPADYARDWMHEDAMRELVRARLGGMAVTTAAAIADALAVERRDVDFALLALEQEGYAMRGRFTPGASSDEWCERHLLARIHRNTLGRLRREIEPVEVRDYVRFLCDWQRVSPATRVQGPEALAGVLAQLEGFEAAAGAWESELLPTRVKDYSIAWLDDLCSAGRVAWTRLRAGGESLVRAAPIVLLPRRELPLWTRLAATQQPSDESPLSSRARKVADSLREHGALFFDELADAAHLLETELEDALAELVARGRASCDSFSGLRALLLPAAKKPASFGRRGRRASLMGIADAGRWSLTRRAADLAGDPASIEPASIEHIARVLLRRYGVVCWRLLEREAQWLPPWRELLREYQRLEARGEIRGGRFIAGVVGQQFALPEAVAALRGVRKRARDGAMIAVSAADPLNLIGGIVAGDKVPRQPGARLLWRDGVPVATLVAGEFTPLPGLALANEPAAQMALLRAPSAPAGSAQGYGSRPMADPLGLHS
ncbi:DEAD/DEAH box helicase [Pseudoxanthomonas helianthi]|uniref:DEAD/DEAH box helicase n=1 Tax=Pseudoxanthomonas helianthi TaxID=1453541 RepID=A0A940X599_9GAMM|nr:DEAD/DEAH box helicase [Pseudoxanthomonas helianthi]MBP3985521.1 DEAD/DEAH box helicase [Pseudoxanthomonas helianthi]